VASLFVIRGADQGKRFEVRDKAVALGRDGTNPIRLHDNEISRRHAELRQTPQGYRLVDLGSANGTYVNGNPIDQAPLRSGDQVQIGQTVMLYSEGASSERDVTRRVDLLNNVGRDDRSAIIRSIPAGEGSKVLDAPSEAAGDWLKVRLANLAVMYQATQAISHIVDPDELLPRVLQLVFESIGADRGAILLVDEEGQFTPKAVRWRAAEDPDDRLQISRTIVEFVRSQGQGVITADATTDKRFGPAESIVGSGVREAICVPIQGRHTVLGVLYADTLTPQDFTDASPKRRFTPEHLTLMVAIGHQSGLAIENTRLYQEKVQAERLAAIGQTIATLSHHIKNILQGIRGGSYLIDMGLNQRDEAIVRRGWTIVEKNQAKIYNLVMDMLSFSKDREPALEACDLNQVVGDVVELMQSRAAELGVELAWKPGPNFPEVLIDPEGMHRAVLNIVTNALDAAEDRERARVEVATEWDEAEAIARISVQDNGVGIAPEDIKTIFQIFESRKGGRGTGLGLPVSRKIVREHSGEVHVTSKRGKGSMFVIELPMRAQDDKHATDAFQTMS
jgi:signal transduction histidine kinase